MTKPKAVAYFRVSSEAQKEKQSIALQKIKLEQFAKEKGYKVIAEFMDDGISGEEISKRPGFRDCLDLIKEDKTDFLLVYMVDRIGRFKARKDRNRVIEALETSKTSVDSPYDGLFLCSREEDLNALEGALNESRRDNKKRGIRVHEGHMARRLNGGFSGGKLPYGIRYSKEEGFCIVEAEKATLEEIFKKIIDGWGVMALRDYLNENLERFPKRVRKYKGQPVTKWSDIQVRQIVHSDFYFTGIIQPTKQSLEKGVPSVDTGLKLFPKETIEHARREMATRRFRRIDERRDDRKRTHAQQGKVFFTDALLHGLARCAQCGWKLGIHHIRRPSGLTHSYYVCRKRARGQCDHRSMSVRKLDKAVWKTFVKTISDPDMMKRLILKGEFLIDKDRMQQTHRLEQATKQLSRLHETIRRIRELYEWQDYTREQYQTKTGNMKRLVAQKEEEIERLKASLLRPKEIEAAVDQATEYVSKQMDIIRYLDQLEAAVEEILGLDEGIEPDDILAQLEIKGVQVELLKDVSGLLKSIKGPGDISVTARELIFKQKRAMLQRFLDFDEAKGIRVRQKDDIEIYFSIESF